jgi:hypothetical protein
VIREAKGLMALVHWVARKKSGLFCRFIVDDAERVADQSDFVLQLSRTGRTKVPDPTPLEMRVGDFARREDP